MTAPPSGPVLVLAAPGLPAATLAAALGRHPRALGLPEGNLVLAPLVDDALVELSGLRGVQLHGTLRALAHLLSGEQTGASVAMARRWLARRAHRPSGDAWREVLALAAPRRAVVPVVAALFHAAARRRLAEAHPDAVPVRLRAGEASLAAALRDGATAAAAGLLGAGEAGRIPAPFELADLEAEAAADLARLIGSHPILTVELEALLGDPAAELARLAAALGWEAGPGEVSAMLRPEGSPFAGPGPFGAHGGGVPSWAEVARRFAPPEAA